MHNRCSLKKDGLSLMINRSIKLAHLSTLVCVVLALMMPEVLSAQEVFTVQASIHIDDTPNLDSTLILLENENTEVASSGNPVLMLSVKDSKSTKKGIRFKPNLKALTASGIKTIPLKPIRLTLGETQTGQIKVHKLGVIQWSFYLQSQQALKQEIPPCLYTQCQ